MVCWQRSQVVVRQADSKVLGQLEAQLATVQRDMQQQMASLQQQNQAAVNQAVAAAQQRQIALEMALEAVAGDVAVRERQTARQMSEMQAEWRQTLEAAAGQIRQETLDAINEQERRLRGRLMEEHQARQQAMQQIDLQLAQLGNAQQRRAEAARSYVGTAASLHDLIAECYPHALFVPGRLRQLAEQIRTAEDDLNQGLFEAGLHQAQQACAALADLRSQLEMRMQMWQVWQTGAASSLRGLLAAVAAESQVPAMDLEGRQLQVELDVNWWSGGKLQDLENTIRDSLQQVERATPGTMDQATLRTIVERSSPDLLRRLELCVREARLSAVGTQVRLSIADSAVEALEAQGFVIQDAAYEGDDERQSYVVSLRDLSGADVVVRIIPVPDEPGQNQLDVHSYDGALRSERELQARANDLARALAAAGLQVTPPRSTGSHADQSLRDMERVRRRA